MSVVPPCCIWDISSFGLLTLARRGPSLNSYIFRDLPHVVFWPVYRPGPAFRQRCILAPEFHVIQIGRILVVQ